MTIDACTDVPQWAPQRETKKESIYSLDAAMALFKLTNYELLWEKAEDTKAS